MPKPKVTLFIPLVIPIAALLSWLGNWFHSSRQKLKQDSRSPFILSDLETFGFTDSSRLPLPENDALLLAEHKISQQDYEGAKHLLINAWLLTAPGIASEPAYLRLKEGFVNLYIARGEPLRAERISQMATMLLDREVQWIVTHPEEQLAASCVESPPD